MVRIRTFGGVGLGSFMLASFAFPIAAQAPNPIAELIAIMAPQDEAAAPPDHMMASACYAELQAIYPEEKHAFSAPVFSRSKVLGDVVRIDYGIAGIRDTVVPVSAPVNRLICYRREGDAKLEMYTARGMATNPDGQVGPIRIGPQPPRN